MDNESRKKLAGEYKERKKIGGVFAVKNEKNGRLFIDCTADIAASRHRFEFSRDTGSCVFPKIRADWETYGAGAFKFEALETITKNDDQSDKAFLEDVRLLKEMWSERYAPAMLY